MPDNTYPGAHPISRNALPFGKNRNLSSARIISFLPAPSEKLRDSGLAKRIKMTWIKAVVDGCLTALTGHLKYVR